MHLFVIAAAALIALALPAAAQDKYPSRPVTLSHGFGAGGNSDTVARILAPVLAERLGQQVIVEPRVGAGGNLATERAAKAAPDGYNLDRADGRPCGFGRSLQSIAVSSGRRPADAVDPDLFSLHHFGAQGSPLPVACRSCRRSQSQAENHHLFVRRRRFDPASCRRIAGFACRHRARACALSRRAGAGHRSSGRAHRRDGGHADGDAAAARWRAPFAGLR